MANQPQHQNQGKHHDPNTPTTLLTILLSPTNRQFLRPTEEIALQELQVAYSRLSRLPRWFVGGDLALESLEDEINRGDVAQLWRLSVELSPTVNLKARNAILICALLMVHLALWTIGVLWAATTSPSDNYIHIPSDAADVALILLFNFGIALYLIALFLLVVGLDFSLSSSRNATANTVMKEKDELELRIAGELELMLKRRGEGIITDSDQDLHSESGTHSYSIIKLSLLCSDLHDRAFKSRPKTYTRSQLIVKQRHDDRYRAAVSLMLLGSSFCLVISLNVLIPTAVHLRLGVSIISTVLAVSFVLRKRLQPHIHSSASWAS